MPLPRALAAYIAASARTRRSFAAAPPSVPGPWRVATAMPIEPSTTIDRPPSWIGRRSSPRIRWAAARRLLLGDDVDEQDRELVAALAADDVALADRARQALRDAAQDVVAGRVAEGVVDPLEVVEVDEQQGDATRARVPAARGRARGDRAAARGWRGRSAGRGGRRG